MITRFHQLFMEPFLLSMSMIVVLAVRVMLSAVEVLTIQDELVVYKWTLLPLIGGIMTSIGAFCFNNQVEVRRIVAGRCTFSVMLAVVLPRVFYITMPSDRVKLWMSDPLFLVFVGIIVAWAAYIFSYPFTRRAYERAPFVAAKQFAKLEKHIEQVKSTEQKEEL